MDSLFNTFYYSIYIAEDYYYHYYIKFRKHPTV